MNNELYQEALNSYDREDFASALTQFTDCLQDPVQAPEAGDIG